MILLISEDPIEEMSLSLYNYLKNKTDVRLIKNSSIPFENNITVFPENGNLNGIIQVENEEIEFKKISAIYIRLSDFNIDLNISEQTKKDIIEERYIYLNSIFEIIDSMIINRPQAQMLNSSKLYQSYIIKKYGFKIPDSIISNDKDKILNFIQSYKKQGVIYKSASSERSKVQKFKDSDIKKLELIKNSPHLFQECVSGVDIRVHAIATGEVFACEIKSETNDYRYDKKRNIRPIELPEKVKQQCIKMTLDMGLYLSGIDLRKTDDNNYYCFEVNPSPAFVWYERQTEQPLTKAIAVMMINYNKYKKLAIRKY